MRLGDREVRVIRVLFDTTVFNTCNHNGDELPGFGDVWFHEFRFNDFRLAQDLQPVERFVGLFQRYP